MNHHWVLFLIIQSFLSQALMFFFFFFFVWQSNSYEKKNKKKCTDGSDSRPLIGCNSQDTR